MRARSVRPWRGTGVMVILAAVIFAYGWHLYASGQSLWADEIASTKFAEEPLGKLWSQWMRRETNPPLYYSLLAGWTWLAGGGDATLRLFSFLAGACAIPLGWSMANRAAGPVAGAAAALLIAFDPMHVFFSQQVRGYAMGHTLALATLALTVALLDRPGDRLRRLALLAGYVMATLGALYVHTTFIVLPALLSAWVAIWTWRNPARRDLLGVWIVANGIVLLGWAWWASITWWQVRHATNLAWMQPVTLGGAVRAVGETYVPDAPVLAKRIAQVALGIGVLAGAWHLRRSAALVLPLVALALPVILYGISLKSPVLLPRTLYWGTGPLLVTTAIGIGTLRPRLLGGALLVALLGVMAFDTLTHRDRTTPQAWAAVADTIREEDPAARVVVIGPPVAYALQRYCRPPACRFEIHTVPLVGETYMADMARPGPVALTAIPALLGQTVFTVRNVARGGGRAPSGQPFNPATYLAPLAEPERLAVDNEVDGNIEVIRWTRR